MKAILIKTIQDVNHITKGLELANLAIMANLKNGNDVNLTDVEDGEIMLTMNKSLKINWLTCFY